MKEHECTRKQLVLCLQAADLLHNAHTGQMRQSKPPEELDVQTALTLLYEMQWLGDMLHDSLDACELPRHELPWKLHDMIGKLSDLLGTCLKRNGCRHDRLLEVEDYMIQAYAFESGTGEDTEEME